MASAPPSRSTSPAPAGSSAGPEPLSEEQAFLDGLYRRIDVLVRRHREGLQVARRQLQDATAQAWSERDAAAAWRVERLASLDVGDHPLCFGRLWFDEGGDLHVGRLALADDEHEPLVLDWRSPAAAPFYRATGVDPLGVTQRRHIVTDHRRVIDINDELLDLGSLGTTATSALSGDGALFAALARTRTAHMVDIVATIQADQDHIIRSSLEGVLVVNGGPGTGKTAVALHRAAYLLYTYRQRLANGVLVVGPNREFMRYISRVIPSLGEEDVALATPQTLVPGVSPTRDEPTAVAHLKGQAAMADVIRRAVADRQRVPRRPHPVVIDPHVLTVSRRTVARARAAARRSRRAHNDAQSIVLRHLADDLVDQLEQQVLLGLDEDTQVALAGDHRRPPSGFTRDERAEARVRVLRSRDFRILLDQVWPILLPGDVLEGLFGFAGLRRSATAGFDDGERALLQREPTARGATPSWSEADIALLDEAAHLLGGPALAPTRDHSPPDDEEAVRVATEVLTMLDLDIAIDPQLLADRYGSGHEEPGLAERAMADPAWRFDHVIVDEAQELSPMQWRMVLRRSRSRSLTVVGDPNQASFDWRPTVDEVIADFAPDRWRRSDLDLNYRTPSQVMDVAAAVLAQERPDAAPPRSIRRGDVEPWHHPVTSDELAAFLAQELASRRRDRPSERVVVIAPSHLAPALRRDIEGVLADAGGAPAAALAAVITPAQAKGLEFDVVLLVEPHRLAGGAGAARGDLYVALTRCTRELGVVHTEPLPAPLEGLVRRAPVAARR